MLDAFSGAAFPIYPVMGQALVKAFCIPYGLIIIVTVIMFMVLSSCLQAVEGHLKWDGKNGDLGAVLPVECASKALGGV